MAGYVTLSMKARIKAMPSHQREQQFRLSINETEELMRHEQWEEAAEEVVWAIEYSVTSEAQEYAEELQTDISREIDKLLEARK